MKILTTIILTLICVTSSYAKLNVLVSITPQKSFVEEIGGDKVDVTLLVPIGTNPNFYEPKASKMMEIDKSDIYFTIGGHFEKAWLPRIKNQNNDMKIIDCSKTVERIDVKSNKKSEKLNSNQLPKKDVHVWTTPKNIQKIGETIYETLVKYDSINKDYYKKNYEAFIKKAQETDTQIKEILQNTKEGTKFMVFHPAWGYFANDYKLEQMPIEVEGKEPKPKEIHQVLEKAKELNIKTILTQPEFSQKGAEVIANELNIKVVEISPLNPKWSQNLLNLAKAISQN
jgi:zinc transport system substrate-binding protein